MAKYIKETIGNNWNGVKIKYYENKRYEETNNIFSLYQASEFCDDDMLMLECDIYYHKEMIEKLMRGEGECNILVSKYNSETMDGTVVGVCGDNVKNLVLGKWQEDDFDYSNAKKTVNIYKFSKDFISKKYMPLIKWYVEYMGDNIYYEKVLGSLIYYRECDVRTIEVPESMWCEIDNQEDLKRAEKQFANKENL